MDDDDMQLRANARVLRHAYLVSTATTAKEALELLKAKKIDLAVLDYRLAPDDIDGIELISRIKATHPHVKCALHSAYAAVDLTVDAMHAGASHVAHKDESIIGIVAALEGQRTPRRARFPTLAELEREHVRRALAETGGNKSKAARLLGTTRETLRAWLAKWKRGTGPRPT